MLQVKMVSLSASVRYLSWFNCTFCIYMESSIAMISPGLLTWALFILSNLRNYGLSKLQCCAFFIKKKKIIAFGKMGFAWYSLLAYKYARPQFWPGKNYTLNCNFGDAL